MNIIDNGMNTICVWRYYEEENKTLRSLSLLKGMTNSLYLSRDLLILHQQYVLMQVRKHMEYICELISILSVQVNIIEIDNIYIYIFIQEQ